MTVKDFLDILVKNYVREGILGNMTVIIRLARLEDAKDLLAIYRYYVEKTAITFEYEVPSLEEFQKRMRSIMAFYPYLVAEEAAVMLTRHLFIQELLMLGRLRQRCIWTRLCVEKV